MIEPMKLRDYLPYDPSSLKIERHGGIAPNDIER